MAEDGLMSICSEHFKSKRAPKQKPKRLSHRDYQNKKWLEKVSKKWQYRGGKYSFD